MSPEEFKAGIYSMHTVIYTESWLNGSHRCSMTNFARIKVYSEPFTEAVKKYGISPSDVNYIFVGWPRMQGEEECEVVESDKFEKNE